MRYIKKFISTLATMNYYSSSSDGLDDHLTPTYLQLVSAQTDSPNQPENDEDDAYVIEHIFSELVASGVQSKMNNSYSSL